MALDFGPKIRVNTIIQWIAVDRTTVELVWDNRHQLERIHHASRIGRPEDVAGVAAFIARDDAAFISRASILVDGGRGVVMQDDTRPDYRSKDKNS